MPVEDITGQLITGIVSGLTRYLLGVILKKSDEKEKSKNSDGRQKRTLKKKHK
jgi:hypothetical protein